MTSKFAYLLLGIMIINKVSAVDYPLIRYHTLSSATFDAVDQQIESAIKSGFPGAVLLILKDGKVIKRTAYGYKVRFDESNNPLANPVPVSTNDLFDLASNTKMYATNYAIMHLVYQNKLDLHKPVSYYIPTYSGCDSESVSQCRESRLVSDLLSHSAGYMSDPQFFNPATISKYGPDLYSQNRESTINVILSRLPFVSARGGAPNYSDVDFMLLGILIENITHQRLDNYLYNTVYHPLGLTHTMFNPEEHGIAKNRCAATEINGNTRNHTVTFPNVRTSTLQCQVHDEKAYYSMGGVTGHAGLFSTVDDVATLVELMLQNGQYHNLTLWDKNIEDQFTQANSYDDTYGLGWRRSGAHHYFPFGGYTPSSTVGHTGFTGTLILIDRANNLAIVLLTNKIHTPFIHGTFVGSNSPTGKYHDIVNLIYKALKLDNVMHP